ncbi:MAG: AMP-binding protein [Mycobacterium sp.]
MFRASVDRHPDRECIVVLGGDRVTYQQMWDRSARVAGGLRAAGVRPGDRVANRHGNSLQWCLGFWGTLMAGAVVVPVNTASPRARSTTSSPTRVRRWCCSPTRRCPTASRTSPPTRITRRSQRSSTPAAPPASPRVR